MQNTLTFMDRNFLHNARKLDDKSNVLLPVWCQNITRTNADLLPIGPLQKNSQFQWKYKLFFQEMHYNIMPFCPTLNVIILQLPTHPHQDGWSNFHHTNYMDQTSYRKPPITLRPEMTLGGCYINTSGQTILLNDRSDRSKPLRSIIDRKANLRSIICDLL